MEYLTSAPTPSSIGKILCCECGVAIEPNNANMCVGCIRTRVDITEGIPKQSTLNWCKFCGRYFQPPSAWIFGNLESKELLAVCLKKLKPSLSKVRLVDAGFIWTEPHSRRIKVKLTIQKEVLGGAVLQQVVPVEFVVNSQMCDDCRKVEAKDYWRASVQVRQKCPHRKTLLYMEQLILKHKAHITTTGIKQMHGGVDFYYARQQDAKKLVEFLVSVLPARYGHAQELVSQDDHNNTFDYKNTFSLEIVPICKDNVVCLPKKLAQSLGNMGQISVCHRVAEEIHLIDPATGQVAHVSSTAFWRDPFSSLCQQKQLVEYIVIDIDPIETINRKNGAGQISNRHLLADAWVMKSSQLGGDNQIHTRTHLGHILKPGDTVLGLDIRNCNTNNDDFDKINPDNLPDVVLVKKVYDRNIRAKKRKWKLKHLVEDGMETDSLINEYTEFLEDLEEDPLSRQKINIYKDLPPVESDSQSECLEEDFPRVSLQEMLDDLDIDDVEMAEES